MSCDTAAEFLSRRALISTTRHSNLQRNTSMYIYPHSHIAHVLTLFSTCCNDRQGNGIRHAENQEKNLTHYGVPLRLRRREGSPRGDNARNWEKNLPHDGVASRFSSFAREEREAVWLITMLLLDFRYLQEKKEKLFGITVNLQLPVDKSFVVKKRRPSICSQLA